MIESLVGLLVLSPIVVGIIIIVRLATLSGKVKKLEESVQTLQRSVYDLKTGAAGTQVRGADVPHQDTGVPSRQPGIAPQDTQPAMPPEMPPPLPKPPAHDLEAEFAAALPQVDEAPSQTEKPKAATAPDRAPVPPKRTSPPPPKPKKPARSREEWESLIGGQWLNRIGAFALIIAMGFFLKYAFDNNWITEGMRVLIGAGIGLALVGGGWWFDHKGLRIFSQGLIGAGISTLYISVYASFNFYHLVPQIPAFILMSFITALTLVHAFKYDSLAVAILGWAGGFLTPIMLSTGTVNTVGLFTYIALLDIGLIAVVLYKDKWVALEPMTLVATYITYFAWNDAYYSSTESGIAMIFLIVFWALFFVPELIRVYRGVETYNAIRQIVSSLNALMFYGSMFEILDRDFEKYKSAATAGIGVVYAGAAGIAYLRGLGGRMPMIRTVITASLLIGVAICAEFEEFAIIAFIALESLAIIWIGWKLELQHIRITGQTLLLIAFCSMFLIDGALGTQAWMTIAPLVSERTAAYLALAATLAIAALFEERFGGSNALSQTLHVGWTLCLLALFSVETSDFFVRQMTGLSHTAKYGLIFNQIMTVGVVWMVFSGAVHWLGSVRNLVALRVTGIAIAYGAVLVAMTRGMVFTPVEEFILIANYRTAVYFVVLIGIIVHSLLMRKYATDEKWTRFMTSLFRVTLSLLVLFYLTAETLNYFQQLKSQYDASMTQMTDEIRRLTNLQQLSLSLVWLVFSIVLMVYGFIRKLRVQRIVAFSVFGISILKIFIYDLSSLDTLYRIFSFIGLGIILLVVSYIYTRYKDVIFGDTEPQQEVTQDAQG